MSFFRALNERLGKNDFIQISLGFFILLLATLAFTWPALRETANNSFFSVALVRLLGLLILAISFGSAETRKTKTEQALSFLAILLLAIASIPFEVATYVVSFPDIPLYWSLIIGLVDPMAYYGFGLIFGHLLRFLRLGGLMPLVIPLVLVGFIFIDIPLGVSLFNPLSSIDTINLLHFFLMSIFATLSLSYLFIFRKSAQP